MKPTKTQIDNNSRTGAEVAGQNPAMAAAGVEVESATLTRTKAQSQEVDLMEQVLLPANLEKAYARVCVRTKVVRVSMALAFQSLKRTCDGIGRQSRPSCWRGTMFLRQFAEWKSPSRTAGYGHSVYRRCWIG